MDWASLRLMAMGIVNSLLCFGSTSLWLPSWLKSSSSTRSLPFSAIPTDVSWKISRNMLWNSALKSTQTIYISLFPPKTSVELILFTSWSQKVIMTAQTTITVFQRSWAVFKMSHSTKRSSKRACSRSTMSLPPCKPNRSKRLRLLWTNWLVMVKEPNQSKRLQVAWRKCLTRSKQSTQTRPIWPSKWSSSPNR